MNASFHLDGTPPHSFSIISLSLRICLESILLVCILLSSVPETKGQRHSPALLAPCGSGGNGGTFGWTVSFDEGGGRGRVPAPNPGKRSGGRVAHPVGRVREEVEVHYSSTTTYVDI